MPATGGRVADHGMILGSSSGATFGWSADQIQVRPEPWMIDARCAETDPEIFFPEKGESTRPAKKICSGCDVVEQCLAYALEGGERFGIWGAKSERERRGMDGRKDMRRRIPPERDETMRRLYDQGLTDPQVAESMNVSVALVLGFRRRHGLKPKRFTK